MQWKFWSGCTGFLCPVAKVAAHLCFNIQNVDIPMGQVVQSVDSLTSSLVVKMLTVLVIQYLIHRYFCWENVSSFCKCKSYSHFFSKNISIYAIFNDQSFNDKLTNDIVSFEQMGPGYIWWR